MRMTPALLVIGGLIVFWASVFVIVLLPAATMEEPPSEIWRPLTPQEKEGHRLWIANGCHYCHSQYIRTNDWGLGAERIAQRGDYVGRQPAILGTERTGPDLSQAGGEHPDDWHRAHFANPRFTRPHSLMPNWEFLGEESIGKLTAYIQSQGMLAADKRRQRQTRWREKAQAAYRRGETFNIRWLHERVPQGWRPLPNPYPATEPAVLRGQTMYEQHCIGCHGRIGDGQGPAAEYLMPPPLNFTELRKHLVEDRYIGGILYYQIMNGITGTAMPYFKRDLESEKIWDVSNYIALHFLGYTDADIDPEGIDASYEPEWRNPTEPPGTDDGDSRENEEAP